ncbi:glycoside hydrolase superfamily [Clohesyomyces aquaticus]|uniref:Alpha-galactosidase n=1 Tax=Clohesyomyces aquaticus TaxID=1231657 RepID=A0A1Y2A1K8_9PLEO|nr:glycoside hydrolase superfamily [Clohesyomyces aquaticus]
MAYVADQIHTLGMKFGIYSSAGTMTCAKYPGSLYHEEMDAKLWASWGVDYVKYDNCFNENVNAFDRYNWMSKALLKTGRQVVYSLCNWGEAESYKWGHEIANSARMSGDIYEYFHKPDSTNLHLPVMDILDKMADIHTTESGFFNDMDMLEVGNSAMTDDEQMAHFTMWAINASPLLISKYIRTQYLQF